MRHKEPQPAGTDTVPTPSDIQLGHDASQTAAGRHRKNEWRMAVRLRRQVASVKKHMCVESMMFILLILWTCVYHTTPHPECDLRCRTILTVLGAKNMGMVNVVKSPKSWMKLTLSDNLNLLYKKKKVNCFNTLERLLLFSGIPLESDRKEGIKDPKWN